ncbi:antibiotic biosynthesis monooxygenase [Arthrobacter sp. H5]|uniref:antibiotic biosynthesis monooxygenase family protein n=1 Tax=Arthrobacter sp. H5 TaxID=1267973 RepID=UPI0020A6A7BC|nr:antibiotic biosynthesis monooxygenase [Arthrobacter sp. H5]
MQPKLVDGFVAAYASGGDWARLFAHADGFVGTELFRDADTPNRFITIDRWRNETDWGAFLEQSREAYQALDTTLARFTVVEIPLFEGTVPTSMQVPHQVSTNDDDASGFRAEH